MKLRIKYIGSIVSAMVPNSSAIDVECDMTETQMRDALFQFCEHISSETWRKWLDDVGDV